MRKAHRNGSYPSPYTAVIYVDEIPYLIVDRQPRGFRAVELTKNEARLARVAFDGTHADVEARLVRARRR